MLIIRYLLLAAILAGLAGCGGSKFKTYNGPEVSRIVIYKSTRKMYLVHDNEALKTHTIELGFAPLGDKEFEGDGKTPEGEYIIDRRNPNSDFHLSIGISYPNAQDIAQARAAGKSPGGDIFIHGQPNKSKGSGPDWTAGCISVKNHEMEDIYAMVKNGTRVTIYP